MKSGNDIDISLIVNFHQEGLVSYRTLRSATRAVRFAELQGIKIEIIAILDNPDIETKKIVLQQDYDSRQVRVDRSFVVSLGSPGASRNFGVGKAVGKYIAFLDGDDMFSENWLAEAYKHSPKGIAHPEINLYFKDSSIWFEHPDCRRKGFDAGRLIGSNLWTLPSFGLKSIYEKIKFSEVSPESGFGQEDWHWNCEVIANNIEHVVIPQTMHMIEDDKQTYSVNYLAEKLGCILPKTKLFDEESNWRNSDDEYELINSDFPQWAFEECKSSSDLEPSIYPNRKFKEKLSRGKWQVDKGKRKSKAYQAYSEILKIIGTKDYDVIYFVPWLIRGGSDLGSIYHINSLADNYDLSVLVIMTEDVDSPWKNRLSGKVTALNYGKISSDFRLSSEVKRLFLARITVQKNPRFIHNINSRPAWEMIRVHGRAISSVTKVYASLFCYDYDAEGTQVGYCNYLPHTYLHLDRVISDNTAFPKQLMLQHGVDPQIFSTVYFPVDEVLMKHGQSRIQEKQLKTQKGRMKVLWAGRMVDQKNPELLLEVAKRLDHIDFHLWGTPSDDNQNEIFQLKNVTNKGTYSSFDAIPHHEYDFYLYTSKWDGLPNTLLEAAAVGLPIVSSATGGISDFITEETGYPVVEFTEADEFIKKINSLVKDYGEAIKKRNVAYELLRNRHSKKSFNKQLESVFNIQVEG